MKYKNFTLDKFQVKAIKAINNNHSVVVSAPTGSGKTLIADYIINRDVKQGIRVIYTAPIKALSNQKYKEFSKEYGKDKVGLMTGDIVINPGAKVLIMTTEIYRNMTLSDDELLKDLSYVIFDEIHFINDIERGVVWEESIIFSQLHVRMLCLSATIPNAREFANWITAIKKHKVEVIRHNIRPVPLHKKFYDTELGISTLEEIHEVSKITEYTNYRGRKKKRKRRIPAPSHIELIKEIKDKTPCIFFCFSRAGCQKNAQELADEELFKVNPEISKLIRKKLEKADKDINKLQSTKLLRYTLPRGIGFHHAGLLPVIKELVEELFGQGLIHVLYTTETFAVGINMPAKSVCFEDLRKFDGFQFRLLNSKEYFQIAGRAGRRGIDKEGYVYAMINRRDFDYHRIKAITSADTTPIKSQFRLSVNTVLNLIKNHEEKEIDKILRTSFYAYQKYGKDYLLKKEHKSHRTFENMKRKLTRLGYLDKGKLTEKGEFATKIYADELAICEAFATDFYKQLNEYQMFLILACLSYERRDRTTFEKLYPSRDVNTLKKLLRSHDYLKKEKRFYELDKLTALVFPVFEGKTIFDVIENTSLLEGDVLRFLRQILDRIGQVKQATCDGRLRDMLDNIAGMIDNSMKDIDAI